MVCAILFDGSIDSTLSEAGDGIGTAIDQIG
jgi:hypothetical protein